MSDYNLFDIFSQKATMYEKAMSISGQLTTIRLMPLGFDFTAFNVNWTMELTTLLDFFFGLDFGLEIEFNDFDLSGLAITLPEITIQPFTIPTITLDINYRDTYEETKITKGVYGVSRYDYSYYDPAFTIRNISYEAKKSLMKLSREQIISSLLTNLNINEQISKYIRYVVGVVQDMIDQNFILGIGLLSWSKMRTRSGEYIQLNYTRDPTRKAVINYSVLDQLYLGFILGISPLSLARLLPRNASVIDNNWRKLPSKRALRVLNDFTPIKQAIKTGESGAGAVDMTKSMKVERWGTTRAIINLVRNQVKNSLVNVVGDPFTLNKYQMAGQELVMAYYRSKDSLEKKIKNVDLDTLKTYWLNKWSSWGLDLNILQRIYDMVINECLSMQKRYEKLRS